MAQQRSGFRIRVPRLRPSVPPPRPAPAETRTPVRKPPVRRRPNPPPSPIPPRGTTPAPPSPPPPLMVVPSPSPSPTRPPLPQEPPTPSPTPPIRHPGTVPAQPPQPQDEQESTAQAPRRAEPSSSLSQTGNQSRVSSHPLLPSRMSTQPPVSAKPASPSTRSEPTSPPSSPPHIHPSQTPSPPTSPQLKTWNTSEVKKSTEIPSNNVRKGTHHALKPSEERDEQKSMEVSSEHSNSESHIKEHPRIKTQKTKENQHKNKEAICTTNDIPNTIQTTSMISHPESESPYNRTPNGANQDLNEKTASVITLAGDNRGTSMHICSGATKREKSIHIFRRYKVNPDETTDATTDGEDKESDSEANENREKNAYFNCNIQGINNSMVFNYSFTERSPGVHLGSCNPENVKKTKRKHIKSTDLSKVKVNVTPSQKHTVRRRCLRGLFMESSDSDSNDPQKPRKHTVRRRCLRGLFMESSDSDSNDPHKPRHHGCRYICRDKTNKEENRDVI